MPEVFVVDRWEDLVLFLGGSPDSFTGILLHLIAKAGHQGAATWGGRPFAFPGAHASWHDPVSMRPARPGVAEALRSLY